MWCGFLKGLTVVSVHHQLFQGVNKRGSFLKLKTRDMVQMVIVADVSFIGLGLAGYMGNTKISN